MAPEDVPSRFAVDLAGTTLLGIYRVGRKIADGGMGSVWRAEDTNLGRRVVVKVPHVRFLGEPGFGARFSREIAELVRLEHPGIVRILAQGVHEQVPFFVLQYLGGGSLEDRLEAAGDGPREPGVLLPWLGPIAATLDFVHRRGVVHRDVKPGNVLFDDEGHVFLSDFGVVKALDRDAAVTDAGTGVGSPRYMAPEQAVGGALSGAADQYGLATTVYEALAGRLPFEGDSALELLMNKRKGLPAPLADLAPGLPADCAAAVMRGLSTDPRERFPSCGAFAGAVLAGAGIFAGTPPGGTPGTPPGSAAAGRRLPAAAAGMALLAVILAALGLAAGWFRRETPPAGGYGPGGETLQVLLLSPGAAPHRTLRYRPVPGTAEKVTFRIDVEEAKTLGDGDPAEVHQPGVSFRILVSVGQVTPDGEIPFAWKVLGAELLPPAETPPHVREAMEQLAGGLAGRSGSGRQSSRGIPRELRHDAPPPEDEASGPLFNLLSEIVEQLSAPLPEEPVGIGARWEVTTSRYHFEGIRLTQTVTYELVSLDEAGAHLRMFVAAAAPRQAFGHPGIPDTAEPRLKKVHADGEGEIVLDLDRLASRSIGMRMTGRAELRLRDGAGELDLVVDRRMVIESRRE